MTGTETAETRRSWRAFAVASASIFMFVLDAGLVSVSLPEVERDFPDATRATVSWVSTGYLVSVAGFLLVSGRLGDVYGRRRVFRIGLAGLFVGSVITAMAPLIGVLVAARIFQGVGGALVTGTALTMVLPDIPEGRRPLAIGLWGSAGSVAAVLGPTLGAEVLDATSWRITVGLIAPLSALTLVAGRTVLREISDPDAPDRISPGDTLAATIGIGSLALGLSQGAVWGWTDPRLLIAVAIGAGAIVGFVVRCSVREAPLLDLRLFGNRRFRGATLAAGMQQIGFFSWFFSTAFVLREIWEWSARDTGQAISLTFVCSTVSGWLGGRTAARFGYFWPTVVSALVAGAGPIYWYLVFDAEASFWTVYLPGSILFGFGGGICGVTTTGMALAAVDDHDQGMAYAAHQTIRRISSATGLALMATLLGEAAGAELLSGARNVWLLAGGVHVAMIIPLIDRSQ